MKRRVVVSVLPVCLWVLTFSLCQIQHLYSAEIILPDLFHDGTDTYDFRDIFYFSTLWLKPVAGPAEGDFNGDGIIDYRDLVPLSTAYVQGLAPQTVITGPTPDPNATSTPTVSSEATSTPTLEPDDNPTSTPTVDSNNTPIPTSTPTVDSNNTPIPTATPTPVTTPNETNPTPTTPATLTPTLTPTLVIIPPTPTPTSTPTPTNPPTDVTPTPLNTPSPTPTLPGSTAPTNTPTRVPTSGSNPSDLDTPSIPPPDFVRLWELHPSLSLFRNAVEIPEADMIAASQEGYAVRAKNSDGTDEFISFDRFGRIFSRTLPISQADYSGLSLVDGKNTFGKFFESPQDTRRFRFEPTTLEAVAGDMVDVEHLGADAIAWAFAGSSSGTVMAILRFPDLIVVHRISATGDYLGVSELQADQDLPTQPFLMQTAVSGDKIAVAYSQNLNESLNEAGPITVWILDLQGVLRTDTPLTIPLEPLLPRIVGDDQGTFYMVNQSLFGPRLNHFSENGLSLDRTIALPAVVDILYQDNLLWLLDGSQHLLYGINEDGDLRNGPFSIFPPNESEAPKWLRLKKSGPDMGAFFTDAANPGSIHYMQIEAGDLATPTPIPAPGVPSGVTVSITIENNSTISMIKIPKGTFVRGSAETELGRRPNEGPQHTVTITQDFFISKTEITNELYKKFDPQHRAPPFGMLELDQDNLPVVGVSWEEASAFCQWLSDQSDFTFSLPTEAEWEYVARSGSITRRPWGSDLADLDVCAHANVADVSAAFELGFLTNFVNCSDGYAGPSPVGSFPANSFGVHDMLGNVREWCLDWFAKYSGESLTDPFGPPTGKSRILRGGSFADPPDVIRSAYRSGRPPDELDSTIGFRVVIREE